MNATQSRKLRETLQVIGQQIRVVSNNPSKEEIARANATVRKAKRELKKELSRGQVLDVDAMVQPDSSAPLQKTELEGAQVLAAALVQPVTQAPELAAGPSLVTSRKQPRSQKP